jgi:hypothetical protein
MQESITNGTKRQKRYLLSAICIVSVSPLIENKASEAERKAGFDLADYIVRHSSTESHEQAQLAETPLKVTPAETPLASERAGQHPAYVSATRTMYIPTPPDGRTTYTVYPSVEAYNKRSALPTIIYMQDVDISGMKQIFSSSLIMSTEYQTILANTPSKSNSVFSSDSCRKNLY